MKTVCSVAAALAIAIACAPASAKTDKSKRLAVLYFDNNTGLSIFDPLQKGFADMLITDLSAVEDLVVVERDKMQAILGELKLQRSKFFDKRTAVKIGKGLGATYAVTGSFATVRPKLRVDVRLIEIKTGRVVLGTSVTGDDDEVFDLEQELVGKFVSNLQMTFAPKAKAQTRVPDVRTLLEYSESLALADEGKLNQAKQRMTAVMQSAPTFALAKIRRDEMIRRLEAFRARKAELVNDIIRDLFKRSNDYLATNDLKKLSQSDAGLYIGFRVLRGRYLAIALQETLSPPKRYKTVLPQFKRQALSLQRAYYDNLKKLLDEINIYQTRFTTVLPNGQTHTSETYRLPPDVADLARRANVSRKMTEAHRPYHALLAFLLLGEVEAGLVDQTYNIGPPLGVTDKKLGRAADKLLVEAYALRKKRAKKSTIEEAKATALLQLQADYHFLHERQELGIAALQKLLDDFPTSYATNNAERVLKEHLGLSQRREPFPYQKWQKGLKSCKNMDLNVGRSRIFSPRIRARGLAGIDYTVKEAEKRCSGNSAAKGAFKYIYQSAALNAGSHLGCDRFEKYMAKMVAAGGSKSSWDKYRQNYTSCPEP